MVANRALAPSSKLAIEQWATEEVYLGDHARLQVQHFELTPIFKPRKGNS
jgi:hypothetical protein